MKTENKKYDLVGNINKYELGLMHTRETVDFFAELVQSGIVWDLQGSYGRMATNLIENGILYANGDINEDIYTEYFLNSNDDE